MSDGAEPTNSSPAATDADAAVVAATDAPPDPGVTVLSIPAPAEPVVEPAPPEPASPDSPLAATILPPPTLTDGSPPPEAPPSPVAYKRLQPRKNPDNRGFVPTLLSTAVFFISLAVAVTITLYSIEGASPDSGSLTDAATDTTTDGTTDTATDTATDTTSDTTIDAGGDTSGETRAGLETWWNEWRHIAAPVIGALVGLVGGSLYALLNQGFARPDRIDPQVYGEIVARLGSLDAQLPVLCPDSGPRTCNPEDDLTCRASCNEAWSRRDTIDNELDSRGSRWVLGSGYIDLYRQLHGAEEALFVVQPATDVMANGLYDDLRLTGVEQAIPNRDALRGKLLAGLALLGGARITRLLPPAAGDPPAGAGDGAPPADVAAQGAAAVDEALGRVILRDVRRAINEFRDEQRANLVRARNELVWTGTFTAVAGFALLALATLAKAESLAVISGVIYYVIGAGVGLFNQLYLARDDDAGVEDFGFARARLFYIPVLSGLAAVGGVMAVALLYYAVDLRPIADQQQQSLGHVFNIKAFGLGVAIAAVFGLTPNLLLDQLNQNAANYRARLKETSAAGESEPPG